MKKKKLKKINPQPLASLILGIAVTVGVSMYVLSISRLSEVDMVILAEITYVHHSETIYYSFIYTTYYNQPTNYIVTEYQTMFTLWALERRWPVKVASFTFIPKRSLTSLWT